MKPHILRDIRDNTDLRNHSVSHFLQQEAVQEFCRINGWRTSSRYIFGPGNLGHPQNRYDFGPYPWRDHPLYLKTPREFKRGLENVAIVGQPYDRAGLTESLERLQAHGLVVHVPPGGSKASIWYPDHTHFFVITKPGIEVQWLPEQVTGIEPLTVS